MDQRYNNLFELSEEDAIRILDTPLDDLEEDESRYVAAAQLVNFRSERVIAALMRAVGNLDERLENRIVRRKAVESLGRLGAKESIALIRDCLGSEDIYMVENAAWAVGEIGTEDRAVLETLAQVLERPGQSYRVIIHTLAKLGYANAVERIQPFIESEEPTVVSAAVSAVSRLSGDDSQVGRIVEFLQHSNVYARRLCIQDLVDVGCYGAIPEIARCPVSLVFRLRGIRLLAVAGIASGKLTLEMVRPYLEQVLMDHPRDLALVHEYDQAPRLEFLIRQLYETDFGQCYLATQSLLTFPVEEVGAALLETYELEAYTDYGAHYHVMKLLGWLRYAPGYELLISALGNREPQYQKSRTAAAIGLGELGDVRAVPALRTAVETSIWELRYGALWALVQLGESDAKEQLAEEPSWLMDCIQKSTMVSAG